MHQSLLIMRDFLLDIYIVANTSKFGRIDAVQNFPTAFVAVFGNAHKSINHLQSLVWSFMACLNALTVIHKLLLLLILVCAHLLHPSGITNSLFYCFFLTSLYGLALDGLIYPMIGTSHPQVSCTCS